MPTTLTILIENTLHEEACAAQHGLACWLDTGTTRLLVDTGQDAVFLDNARRLGVPVTDAGWLLLTHGHYDHTGGGAYSRLCPAHQRHVVHGDRRQTTPATVKTIAALPLLSRVQFAQ